MSGFFLILLTVRAGITVFGAGPRGTTVTGKWRGTRNAFNLLGTQLAISALMLLATLIIPPGMTWTVDGSRNIQVAEEQWQRVLNLAGPQGNSDDQLCRLIALADEPDPDEIRLYPERELQRRLECFPWFHSVRIEAPGLSVYVLENNPQVERAVPRRYSGVEVALQQVALEDP